MLTESPAWLAVSGERSLLWPSVIRGFVRNKGKEKKSVRLGREVEVGGDQGGFEFITVQYHETDGSIISFHA